MTEGEDFNSDIFRSGCLFPGCFGKRLGALWFCVTHSMDMGTFNAAKKQQP